MNQGYKFACDAKNMAGVELVAVAGDNSDARQRAKALQVPVYSDYKKMVGELVLDGIIIALPNPMHGEAVVICSRKCASLLVEKPIAETEPLLEETVSCVKNDPMTAELSHFIQVVQGLEEPLVTGEDALEILRILQAAKQSALHRQVVHLHEPPIH